MKHITLIALLFLSGCASSQRMTTLENVSLNNSNRISQLENCMAQSCQKQSQPNSNNLHDEVLSNHDKRIYDLENQVRNLTAKLDRAFKKQFTK